MVTEAIVALVFLFTWILMSWCLWGCVSHLYRRFQRDDELLLRLFELRGGDDDDGGASDKRMSVQDAAESRSLTIEAEDHILLQTMKRTIRENRRARETVALSFHSLAFTLKSGQQVLKGVSGRFRPGKLTALMGPSGSGVRGMLNSSHFVPHVHAWRRRCRKRRFSTCCLDVRRTANSRAMCASTAPSTTSSDTKKSLALCRKTTPPFTAI